MPAIVPILAVASIASTAYGMVAQKRAANQQAQAAENAAQVDQATADYNAKADMAMASQLDLDTQQNIRTARQENAVYLSRQEASYASAGVLATTGSPLHTQITNAGRMEQQIQQAWVNSQQKQQQFAAAAKVGRLEGAANAAADRAGASIARTQGSIALLNGGARLAGIGMQDYQSGVFSGLFAQKPSGSGEPDYGVS